MRRAPDRTRAPEPGPLPPLRIPEYDRLRLSGGLEVWLVRDESLPELSLRLVVRAGADGEAPDRMGAAELTGRLLTEGAGSRSAREMAVWQDRLGVGFHVSVGYDAALVSLHALQDVWGEGLELMSEAVRRPRFPEGEVERVREELADEIRRDGDKPEVVADRALVRAVFGDHRYGVPTPGTTETVEELEREHVRAFHRGSYTAKDATVLVCGDVEPEALREELEERFGDWEAGEGPAPAPEPAPGARKAGSVLVVDRPGSAQAEIRIGTVGARHTAEDFFECMVADALLGGLFNSRVNMNLREDKGWTYGARTNFHFRRLPGPFVGRAAVATDAAAPALQEFLSEVRGLVDRPPSEEELELARNSLVLSLPRRFETPSQMTRRMSTQAVYGHPPDFWRRYRERIESVTVGDVVETARRRLDPDSMVSVVVAEADDVTGPLESRFGRVERTSA